MKQETKELLDAVGEVLKQERARTQKLIADQQALPLLAISMVETAKSNIRGYVERNSYLRTRVVNIKSPSQPFYLGKFD